jgi:hypothetical protein
MTNGIRRKTRADKLCGIRPTYLFGPVSWLAPNHLAAQRFPPERCYSYPTRSIMLEASFGKILVSEVGAHGAEATRYTCSHRRTRTRDRPDGPRRNKKKLALEGATTSIYAVRRSKDAARCEPRTSQPALSVSMIPAALEGSLG